MAGLMDALGVALFYVLSAGVIAGCIAFAILAEMLQREENEKNENA